MNSFEKSKEEYGSVMFGGKEYALTSQAEFDYRSHNARGFQLQEPNNWMSVMVIDKSGNKYIAWYYIDNEHINDEDLSDAADWENPNDVILMLEQ